MPVSRGQAAYILLFCALTIAIHFHHSAYARNNPQGTGRLVRKVDSSRLLHNPPGLATLTPILRSCSQPPQLFFSFYNRVRQQRIYHSIDIGLPTVIINLLFDIESASDRDSFETRIYSNKLSLHHALCSRLHADNHVHATSFVPSTSPALITFDVTAVDEHPAVIP